MSAMASVVSLKMFFLVYMAYFSLASGGDTLGIITLAPLKMAFSLPWSSRAVSAVVAGMSALGKRRRSRASRRVVWSTVPLACCSKGVLGVAMKGPIPIISGRSCSMNKMSSTMSCMV